MHILRRTILLLFSKQNERKNRTKFPSKVQKKRKREKYIKQLFMCCEAKMFRILVVIVVVHASVFKIFLKYSNSIDFILSHKTRCETDTLQIICDKYKNAGNFH